MVPHVRVWLGACALLGMGWAMSPLTVRPCAAAEQDLDAVVGLFELLLEADADTAKSCLNILLQKIHDGEVDENRLAALRARLDEKLQPLVKAGAEQPLFVPAVLLQAAWKDPQALARVRALARDESADQELRLRALNALVLARDAEALPIARQLLAGGSEGEVTAAVLAVLGRSEVPQVADLVLECYDAMPEATQPKAIELLTQRAVWSKTLLAAIAAKRLSPQVLNANQVSKLLASKDETLRQLVQDTWGTVRTERNPQREAVIAEMREFLRKTPADPHRGQVVFQKVCGQCHKIYGQGQEVGPDITVNGRASYEQLLSNVLDPSLVIGAAYQARTVITADGRVLTGLAAEDNEQRIVLKLQGGKIESVARDDIDEVQISRLSLMPEGLEKQLPPQEFADLFAFLSLDKPPSDPAAAPIPGNR